MMNIYTEKSPLLAVQPNKEIIQFLLSYFKQLRVVKTNKNVDYIELSLN